MAFRLSVPVRFNDCDGMRHVNNTLYLSYVEEARIAYFVALRTPGDRAFAGRGLIHARTEIDYLSPTFYGRGDVDIDVRVLKVGTKSATLGYEMSQGGTPVARAVTVTVGYDYDAEKSRPLSDTERATLERELAAPD